MGEGPLNRMRGPWFLVCLALALGAAPARGGDATAELLTAPRVRSYVRLSLGTGPAPAISLDGIDVDDYAEPLSFLVSSPVKFVIADYNPLAMELKLDAAETEDPSQAQLDKFLAAFFKTFVPESGSKAQADALKDRAAPLARTPCPEAERAADGLVKFDAILRGAQVSAADVKAWTEGAIGRPGIESQSVTIRAKGTLLTESARQAKETLAGMEALAAELQASSQGVGKARGERQQARDAALAEVAEARDAYIAASRQAASATPKDQAKAAETEKKALSALDGAEKELARVETALAAASADGACPREVLAMLAVFFRTQPGAQVERLARLGKAATALAESLGKLAKDNDAWYPPTHGPDANPAANAAARDYVLKSKRTPPGKVVTLTVTARRTALEVSDDSIVKVAVPKSDSKAVFRMRRHQLFAPELGAGLVLAGIRTPTYGAVKNQDGTLAVAKTKVQDRDFKGALMLNAVCRCWKDSFLYPMLQFGVAADQNAPALFVGAGFRFIRAKGLGISAGVVLAWVKDLDALRIGSEVGSQAAIDADLKAQPTAKPYFALHYSF